MKRPWLVFSDDWGRHPSSCQHLVSRLLTTQEVVWVNTVGTRPPRLDRATFFRAAGKFCEWFGKKEQGSRPKSPAPRIVAPKMWPSFGSPLTRRVNQSLLLRALQPVIESLPELPNVVTTIPLVADLVGKLKVNRWVYYCVDDFSVWPGYDGITMGKMEKELVGKIDAAIAVSETLKNHLQTLGRDSHLLTHGVDLAHWRSQTEVDIPEIDSIPKPLIVFWGVIDRRLDLRFVKELVENLREGTFLFVGPRDDPDSLLETLPRVRLLPPMPYAALPTLARRASVLVMPYIDAPVTRAMQPLKFKEYLATGKPAVVRSLPATESWREAADVVDSPDEFRAQVLLRLREGVPENQRKGREKLEEEGWDAKARLFEDWVNRA